MDWLISCFDAIRPGVDLRLAVARFEASTATTGMACWIDEALERVAQPAFDILCARARGVLVPEAMVDAAKHAVEITLKGSFRYDGTYSHGQLEAAGGVLLTMAFALDGDPVEAATVAAETDFSPKISGDVWSRSFWCVHSWELLDVLRHAPATRIKIVDLNRTATALDNFYA